MTTTPPSQNGNGNGNGFTQKEMLARLDSKLDLIAAGLEAVKLEQAVHEVRPHHEGGQREIEAVRAEVQMATRKLATYAGGIAVAAFLVQIAVRVLLG